MLWLSAAQITLGMHFPSFPGPEIHADKLCWAEMGLGAHNALLRHVNGGYELIVTARNQIIIVGSKAFNLRNHRVRATVSCFIAYED